MTSRLLILCALHCTAVMAQDPELKSAQPDDQSPQTRRVALTPQAAKLAAQEAANKRLAELQRAVATANATYIQAQKALADAQGETERVAAKERVARAKQQLVAARAVVAKQRATARANQAIVVRQGGSGFVFSQSVRTDVDREDKRERFLLLVPGGPLVVETELTIAGRPFRVAREELIDKMLAGAAKNTDGRVAWEEALSSTRFTFARFRTLNQQQLKAQIARFDTNKDGLVDRSEARQFVAMTFGGPAFNLAAGNVMSGASRRVLIANQAGRFGGSGSADVKKLLDANHDGRLTATEIEAAPERLKSRDADDNDLLYPNELSGTADVGNRPVVRTTSRVVQRPGHALLLGPTAQGPAVLSALQSVYKNEVGELVANSFAAVPALFEVLDDNRDGNLDQNEILQLNTVPPHIELTVDLGQDAKGLAVKSLAASLTKSSGSPESLSLELPGIHITVSANLTVNPSPDYSRMAETYLTRYDKDGNEYLGKGELPANFVRQFEMWDQDADGKVYSKEIEASFERQQAPQKSQIRATVSNEGNSLFQALDTSGDGRLGLREIKTAPQQLAKFDENNDGTIESKEIPVAFALALSLANTRNMTRISAFGRSSARPGEARPAGKGPAWFTRMDRNGDGDVTLKEFLGDKEEFEKLDANHDGFIERKEAQAAGG